MELVHVGGPTALITLGGLALLTDPTFDEPGDYQLPGRTMTKLTGPSLQPDDLGPIDAVLLSHDQHWDNLDRAGRALLPTVPVVLSTPEAADRRPEVTGVETWTTVELDRPTGGTLTVTAVPARHGPAGCEPTTGAVTGFVLSGADLPTVYVSGDNAAVELVADIVARTGPIDVAVLFAGAARTPLFDGAPLTLTVEDAVAAASLLDPALILPIHTEGWAHLSEGPAQLAEAFAAADLAGRLRLPVHGERIKLDL